MTEIFSKLKKSYLKEDLKLGWAFVDEMSFISYDFSVRLLLAEYWPVTYGIIGLG